jgi:hypothetical protein
MPSDFFSYILVGSDSSGESGSGTSEAGGRRLIYYTDTVHLMHHNVTTVAVRSYRKARPGSTFLLFKKPNIEKSEEHSPHFNGKKA